jgi:hypothetical protein
MKNKQFPRYPQELEDNISALSEYLFEKYNDAFDIFYFEECDNHVIDMSYSNCVITDEYGNEDTQNL